MSPRSSSTESASDKLLMDRSFSTGGGAGTSILAGLITDDRFGACSRSAGGVAADLSSTDAGGEVFVGVAFPSATEGTVGVNVGDVGGNLNSLFMVPVRLFLFSETEVGVVAVLCRSTVWVSGSSSLSSNVGSK